MRWEQTVGLVRCRRNGLKMSEDFVRCCRISPVVSDWYVGSNVGLNKRILSHVWCHLAGLTKQVCNQTFAVRRLIRGSCRSPDASVLRIRRE